MNYKPHESILISYLYGELDKVQTEKLQRYFHEHPEELAHLQQLKDVVGILGNVADKEVIAPPILMDDDKKVRSFWSGNSFRTILSIAASFLLILVAARLMQLNVSYSNNELRISFGETQRQNNLESPTAAGLTEDQVQQMIQASLAKNNQQTELQLVASQKKLDRAIQQNLAVNSQRIDQLMQQVSSASQDQVRTFVAGLQTENLQLMKDYLRLSSDDQKKYMENLLVDFSKYLQEQRKQDLQMFQTRFNSIEQNTDIFKQETEQILASIISGSEVEKKQSNY